MVVMRHPRFVFPAKNTLPIGRHEDVYCRRRRCQQIGSAKHVRLLCKSRRPRELELQRLLRS